MRERKIKIGINGFGRIGRITARIILSRPNLQLVAINSRANPDSHAYLLKYDSSYGTFSKKISSGPDYIEVDASKIAVTNYDKPADIPWDKFGIDLVIDSSGKFRTTSELEGHLRKGVKQLVLSAPAKDSTKTVVMGVNESTINPDKDKIVSNSSCTTNCLATTLKVLDDNFVVIAGFMTTTHAVTDSQNLLDNSHSKETRLRRAAFASLIPASTGSAIDIGKLFPTLAGRIVCQAVRVPLLTVSLLNLTVQTKKKVNRDMVNKAYKLANLGKMRGILSVATEELVSRDYTGNTHSAIIDPYLTSVIEPNMVNVYAWYDNEWGYTSRLIDLVEYIGNS